MVGRIVETYKPDKKYPTTDEATYLQFRCNYCLKKFYLVEPDNQHSSITKIFYNIRLYE